MRTFVLVLMLTAAGAVILVGCSEKNKIPYFTRLHADNYCGVAPFLVEFTATATGGDPFDQPTGGNSYLETFWDFGDGVTAEGSSIAYHTYSQPGLYEVTVLAKDRDGDESDPPGKIFIEVRDDSLTIDALALIDAESATVVPTCDPVQFTVLADACGFDTDTGDYFRFLYFWEFDDDAGTVYRGRSPMHTFALADTGQHTIKLTLIDPARAISREDLVTFTVVPGIADLEVRKTVDNENPNRGDTITYSVVLLNNGPDYCPEIDITDRLPTGLSFVSAEPSKGTYDPETGIWNVPGLLGGNNVRLFLSAAVDTNGIQRTNVARISRSRRCDLNSANNSASVVIVINP